MTLPLSALQITAEVDRDVAERHLCDEADDAEFDPIRPPLAGPAIQAYDAVIEAGPPPERPAPPDVEMLPTLSAFDLDQADRLERFEGQEWGETKKDRLPRYSLRFEGYTLRIMIDRSEAIAYREARRAHGAAQRRARAGSEEKVGAAPEAPEGPWTLQFIAPPVQGRRSEPDYVNGLRSQQAARDMAWRLYDHHLRGRVVAKNRARLNRMRPSGG